MYKIFRKYSIFPATQNKDERLFSMVGQNTGPHCCKIKAETIKKKLLSALPFRSMASFSISMIAKVIAVAAMKQTVFEC